MIWLQPLDVEDFIGFPKSIRSSKSEFGAKSYGQNTTSNHVQRGLSGASCSVCHLQKLQWLPLTASTCGMSDAPQDNPVHRRKLHNCFPTAIFELGPIYTSCYRPFEGVGA
jgi:hypothetical protein